MCSRVALRLRWEDGAPHRVLWPLGWPATPCLLAVDSASLTANTLVRTPDPSVCRAEAERKLAESKRLATTGAWKPTQSYKTDMVRSIVRMNLR